MFSVTSGDTVTLTLFPAGGDPALPADPSRVPADYCAALDGLVQGNGAHFVTGPVYVTYPG